jgi:hypothetical protein
VKEGKDVAVINYCGNRNNPYVGFLSKSEPQFGTGIERSGNTYRIRTASGAVVNFRVNFHPQALWVDVTITLSAIDYNHVDGMCGSWDRNAGNDRQDFRASRQESLFFYKPKATNGKICHAKDACNSDKKFVASGGFTAYAFPGQQKCNKEREEKDDPNVEVLPDKEEDPDQGLPENPEDFKPEIPKFPTPTGKTEDDARKKCAEKLKKTETYKKCKKVLGKRFVIKKAVEQCVTDVKLTDDYKMAVPAAFTTMKTLCLDEANDDEEKEINGETCPNDCNGKGDCKKGKCVCKAGFSGFDCGVAPTKLPTPFREPTKAPTEPPTTAVPDFTYENYKDKECRTDKWEVKGCYNTKVPFKRGKLLVYWRKNIKWKRISAFAKSMACACADAARHAGAEYFGLHFWGECWALERSEIQEAPEGDCLLADGKYKTKCSEMNKRYDNECLADQSYYTYKLK